MEVSVATQRRKTTVFIYGSCMTLEAVPWFESADFELVGYHARCTLPSAVSQVALTEVSLDPESIPPGWRRAMHVADVTGAVTDAIAEQNPDLVIWDLVFEQSGVIELQPGKYISAQPYYTGEMRPPGRTHTLGQEAHRQIWAQALDRFIARLNGRPLVVNDLPWATINDAGHEVAGGAERSRTFNSNIRAYLDLIRGKGIPVLSLPDGEVVARADHKWGEAPFHFVDSVYIDFVQRLRTWWKGYDRRLSL